MRRYSPSDAQPSHFDLHRLHLPSPQDIRALHCTDQDECRNPGFWTWSDRRSASATHCHTKQAYVPFGAKGMAESATVGAPPAIANAVVDALSHLGVTHIDIPITPEKVWKILKDRKS